MSWIFRALLSHGMCPFGRLQSLTTGTLNSALCSIGPHTWRRCGGLFWRPCKLLPTVLVYHSHTVWSMHSAHFFEQGAPFMS